MKVVSVIGMSIVLTIQIAAQDHKDAGIVSGLVRDATRGRAIAGVAVHLTCSGKLFDTVTDAEGIFRIPGVPLGTCRITANAESADLVTQEFVVEPTDASARMLVLRPIPAFSPLSRSTSTVIASENSRFNAATTTMGPEGWRTDSAFLMRTDRASSPFGAAWSANLRTSYTRLGVNTSVGAVVRHGYTLPLFLTETSGVGTSNPQPSSSDPFQGATTWGVNVRVEKELKTEGTAVKVFLEGSDFLVSHPKTIPVSPIQTSPTLRFGLDVKFGR